MIQNCDLLGRPIYASVFCENSIPRMKLAENVPVTPEFRASIDLWMREFFGCTDAMILATDPINGNQCIYTSQRNIDKMMAGQ